MMTSNHSSNKLEQISNKFDFNSMKYGSTQYHSKEEFNESGKYELYRLQNNKTKHVSFSVK